MGLRVNTNITALTSYNALSKNDKAMSSSLEKLSSGYRINKAADDAAGLVVSEGLKSQINGLTVASRNAQDGVNVAQTADGALGTMTDILQRMRDLAVQASNSGSQDSTAQAAASTEFQQLSQELTRISDTTSFGGKNLLDGTYGVQAANVSGYLSTSSVTLTGTTNFSLTAGGGAVTVSLAAGTYTGAQYASVLENAIKSALSAGTTAQQALVSKFSVTSAAVGSGTAITIKEAGVSGTTFSLADGTSTPLATLGLASASVTAASGSGGEFQIGANNDATNRLTISFADMDATALGVSSQVLTSSSAAQAAITAVDTALGTISTARATVGATQNRFEKTISNLATSIENITASNSAIRDTDMAAEMTKYTKNQVLTQAGTSMLAQANSSSQNILTLLRG